MKKKQMLAVLLTMAVSGSATAAEFDLKHLTFGAGASYNQLSGFDSATGYQIFLGYQFGELAKNVKWDLEIGYLNGGSFERSVNDPLSGTRIVEAEPKGSWAAGVFRIWPTPSGYLIGRVGYDFGDDDGVLIGVGSAFRVNRQFDIRVELVERDRLTSFQVNLVFSP